MRKFLREIYNNKKLKNYDIWINKITKNSVIHQINRLGKNRTIQKFFKKMNNEKYYRNVNHRFVLSETNKIKKKKRKISVLHVSIGL